MYKEIEEIINGWDPMNLLPLAPDDEYSFEIKKIIDVLEKQPDINESELDAAISQIFNQAFDVSYFHAEDEHIAKQILFAVG
ncbi:DUF1871 family protein [Enterococcus sp. BWM-S5]|uniref:DUF1871 family protein n=1 Tax=Enterococcus larvae TaxID=2794352 RepID=A0ABS4CRK4_9ENTE|nr:DUF1871 family protein [Enterococcus larvae]MBP1048414.1 DUF1871 family protein [Enterococcus larvae]